MTDGTHAHRFCGLGDERSFVDPVSTLSNVSSIDVGRHLTSLWQGTLPLPALPIALHEASHHDHLSSPVGIALAAIHLRIRKIAVALAKHQQIVISAAGNSVDDLLAWRQRYDEASMVFRVISEGLACIAQFDAVPYAGDAGVSLATRFAMVTAAREVPSVLKSAALQAWLTPTRMSEESLAGKADLYADGFHCRNGGYLPGYMLVRQCWARCAAEDARFRSAETFLSVIRHVIFSDYALVRLILSASFQPIELAENLIGRITTRICGLSSAELVQTYDRLCVYRSRAAGEMLGTDGSRSQSLRSSAIRRAVEEATGRQIPPEFPDSAVESVLFNDMEEVVAGHRLLEAFVESTQTPNRFMTDTLAVELNRAVWKRRGWFWLGSYPVVLTPVGAELFCSNGAGITSNLPWLPNADTNYMGDGWLTVAYDAKRAVIVVAAGVYDNVLAATSTWTDDEPAYLEAMALIGEQSALIGLDATVRKLVDQTCSDWNILSALDAHCSEVDKVLTRRIAEVLLCARDGADIDAFLAATARDGLAGLASPDLLRVCALLSVCGSSGLLPESIRWHVTQRGYDLDESMQQVAVLLESFGGKCQFFGDQLQMSL